MKKGNNYVLLQNKKARFEYTILEEFIAGLVLTGKEVNFIRHKEINLSGKFIIHQKNQLQIIGLSAGKTNFNLTLLFNNKEKNKVISLLAIKGQTCIPLEILRVGRWIKCKIAVVKGKNKADKREYLKEKDLKREMRNELI
jgi:SsrA-binding protein